MFLNCGSLGYCEYDVSVIGVKPVPAEMASLLGFNGFDCTVCGCRGIHFGVGRFRVDEGGVVRLSGWVCRVGWFEGFGISGLRS